MSNGPHQGFVECWIAAGTGPGIGAGMAEAQRVAELMREDLLGLFASIAVLKPTAGVVVGHDVGVHDPSGSCAVVIPGSPYRQDSFASAGDGTRERPRRLVVRNFEKDRIDAVVVLKAGRVGGRPRVGVGNVGIRIVVPGRDRRLEFREAASCQTRLTVLVGEPRHAFAAVELEPALIDTAEE